jgi:drug/metabolite transporter (DMT)-like permease
MTKENARAGIWLMIAATFVFSAQDGISRHLAETYNVFMVVMIRYWFFLFFVVAVSRVRTGSIMTAARTEQPFLQFFRGLLLAVEILITVYAFTLLGLIEAHAIFAIYPLLVAALSGLILGEKVGWRRWAAIGIGFLGMLVILQPGFKVFSPASLVALLGAFIFALYNLLTRFAAAKDSATTSFFWTGLGGFLVMTAIGPFFWQPMAQPDWGWMALLCVTGATGHYLLIKAYEMAEASTVQPFAYLQLVFASMIGVTIFGESLPFSTGIGAGLIVLAGIFTLWRERVAKS